MKRHLRPGPGFCSTTLSTSICPANGPNLPAVVSVSGCVGEFDITPSRKEKAYWIVAGTQTPLIVARGPLTCKGSLNFDPTNSEMPLDLMLLNSQPPLSITTSNTGIPNSGPPFTLTFTASQAAMVKSKVMGNTDLIGYDNSFETVSNATDVGGSGGLGPCTITVVNNTATY